MHTCTKEGVSLSFLQEKWTLFPFLPYLPPKPIFLTYFCAKNSKEGFWALGGYLRSQGVFLSFSPSERIWEAAIRLTRAGRTTYVKHTWSWTLNNAGVKDADLKCSWKSAYNFFNPHPRICLMIFRGVGWDRESETSMWEGDIDWLLPLRTMTWDRTCDLGMCPDWELNPQPFGAMDDAPISWATPPKPYVTFDSPKT